MWTVITLNELTELRKTDREALALGDTVTLGELILVKDNEVVRIKVFLKTVKTVSVR